MCTYEQMNSERDSTEPMFCTKTQPSMNGCERSSHDIT